MERSRNALSHEKERDNSRFFQGEQRRARQAIRPLKPLEWAGHSICLRAFIPEEGGYLAFVLSLDSKRRELVNAVRKDSWFI